MKYLRPPTTPFALAVYCFAWFALVSLLVTFVAPQLHGNGIIFVLFCVVGGVYGKVNGKRLSFSHALRTNLYFLIPLFLMRILPGLPAIFSGIPQDEKSVAIPLMIGLIIGVVGLHLLLNSMGLWAGARIAAKK